jgi:transketolase
VRTAFIQELFELARNDRRIFLVVGDLGYSVVEPFASEFPDRFLNVGVAEQNMAGIAAGIALSGKIVFTYSIANFPTLRCLEQIRNDICYHGANVKIVAVGGGLAYGPLGFSHHGTEELGILRALPNLAVLAPADPVEAALATRAMVKWPGPCYMRLGKAGEPKIHRCPPVFRIGYPLKLRAGHEAAILSTGVVAGKALAAAERLEETGITVAVYSVHTLKPLATEWLTGLAVRFPLLVTVEEHTSIGGLGSAVAEILAEMPSPHARLKRIALPDAFQPWAGSQEFLWRDNLSAGALYDQVREAIMEIAEAPKAAPHLEAVR